MTIMEKQDAPTVKPSGERLQRLIDGVIHRQGVVHIDSRGELGEIYDPRWGVMDAPLVYIYHSMIRPGSVKGWVYHKKQFDRFYVIAGLLKIVMYDPRADSPTKGMINEVYLTERNRGLLVIPPLVIHAVENIGTTDCYQLNMPTVPYDHDNPDKFRVRRESVPYEFGRKSD